MLRKSIALMVFIGARVSAQYDRCTGNTLWIEDAYCDYVNNNAECGYDGGDCCYCSCVDGPVYSCGENAFDCQDPEYVGDELFDCIGLTVDAPCPSGPLTQWTVNDTASATALADAILCSDGAFTVQWVGHVVVTQTIKVVNRTTLHVTGVGPGAKIQAGSGNRLFTVINASLDIGNIEITGGHANFGGAIAAARSYLFLNNTSFTGNYAVHEGGAVYATLGSLASFGEGILFKGNHATFGGAIAAARSYLFCDNTSHTGNYALHEGGALHATFDSIASFGEGILFEGNHATFGGAIAAARSYLFLDNTSHTGNYALHEGGALYATFGSLASFGEGILFEGNHADIDGGALSFRDSSRATFHGFASFTGNTAGRFGGALLVISSNVYWAGDAIFSNNIANEVGGALAVFSSSIFWEGYSIFSNNTANMSGGGLYISYSNTSWTGDADFSNNSANGTGGALLVISSNVYWAGDAIFSNNIANEVGGALGAFSSSIFWEGYSIFSNNIAKEYGGALYISSSNTSWTGDADFSNNTANGAGGAVSVFVSSVSWAGDTIFSNNTANDFGGALMAMESNISWNGNACFFENTAMHWGGALVTWDSNISWARDALFSRNTANLDGGALLVYNISNVHWGAWTSFEHNAAGQRGGALYIIQGARVFLEQGSLFLGNTASGSGGAVFIYGENRDKQQASSLYVNSTTTFLHNECGGNGGALAVVTAGSVTFATTNVSFSQNSAHAAGGAVAVIGSETGPQFTGLTFASNHAQIGGAVFVTSSGTATTDDQFGVSVKHPTTFDRCSFSGNQAMATGGAIASRAGLDVITNTIFIGNTARAGGALRLAGISLLHNCTFTENTSDNGEGLAVSNAGFVSSMTSCSFVENAFKCEPGEFLDYRQIIMWEGAFDVACGGCDVECHQCTISKRVPTCSEELEHTKSIGGNITIEMLQVESGYWRATNTSRKALPCYNADACLGGITGTSNYCSTGYEGPYCSICCRGYFSGPGYSCSRCSGGVIPVVVTVIVVTSALLVGVLLLSYLICDKSTGRGRGLLASWRRRLLSLKIIVIVWQVMTQFASVVDVRYPGVYQRFLDVVSILNFDLSWILSAECAIDLDFHHRLFMSTLGPPVAFCLLRAIYGMYRLKTRAPYADFLVVTQEENRYEYLPMVLLLTFLVYSSVSSTLFRMFAFDELDDGRRYLRADYRIDYNSLTHRYLQVYAALMMVVYTVGIPLLYGTLLLRNRRLLMNEGARQQDAVAKSMSSLWELYKPNRFYYELIECTRRILLAGVVVFIFPNTTAQVAVALMIAAFFMVFSERMAPYESLWDTWINRIGHAIVFGSIYVALLLKIDVSNEREESQRVFEAILIVGHACMVVLVILGGAVVTYQWTKTRSYT